jgi:putative ABC transport system permease protein
MTPPRRALAFLRWFCREDYIDEIEGDLTELFMKNAKISLRSARWLFALRVLRYFRPAFIKPFRNYRPTNPIDMFRNYFKVAMRGLIRNNGYSFINIGGLALGMTVTMLIGLWVNDELSFDKYHKNYDRIGQLWAGGTNAETMQIDGSVAVQLPMAAVLKSNYQRYFEHVLVAWWVTEHSLSTEQMTVTKMGEMIEPAGPEMFSLNMLKGSYSCLKDPHSIILSESLAKTLFGDKDPINESLMVNNRLEVKVTGVYADIPRNNRFSEVQFFIPWDLWLSSNSWVGENDTNWNTKAYNIYVQLQPGISFDEVNAAMHDFYIKNAPKDYLKEKEKRNEFAQVIPMSTWHLYGEFEDGKPSTGRIVFVWLFSIVGFFVLLLACINFINLSTARSEKRSREVGVRKSIGSGKMQLVFQFLSESFAVVLSAFLFSMILLAVSLDSFNTLADKDIQLPWDNLIFWMIMMAFVVVTGFMAGVYPAFYLSSFQPVKVLKGTFRLGRLASLPRKVLVVVQFTVSVVLIIGTVVVYQQIQHARSRPVGYDRSGLLNYAINDPNFGGKYETIRIELINTGAVANVAYSSNPLTEVWNYSGRFIWKRVDPDTDIDFAYMHVTRDFGNTVGWHFIAGRDFSRDLASDSASVILNETAARLMGFKDPINQEIGHEGIDGYWKVIGVIRDMVMASPYEPVKPTLFFPDTRYRSSIQMQVKLEPTVSAPEALPKVQAVIRQIVPSAGLDFKFVDHEYGLKFAQEQRIGTLAGLFAGLAIFISCMGLFGLASFVTEQRTKEIGIRKVLGASVPNLWNMLSRDFMALVTISCVIAMPLSYYVMDRWLQKFTYHTQISWFVFPLTIAGALLLTLVTVSFQAVRAAMMNPVRNLRTE